MNKLVYEKEVTTTCWKKMVTVGLTNLKSKRDSLNVKFLKYNKIEDWEAYKKIRKKKKVFT